MLSLHEKCTFLKGTDLFAHVPDSALEQIAAVVDEVSFTTHTCLFHEGEVGDALYLIVQGQVRILKEGIEVLVRGSGDCVGEMALLDEAPRSATVEALTDVLTLRLPRDEFQRISLHTLAIPQGIYQLLARKLRTDLEVQIEAIRAQEQLKQDIRRAYEIQQSMLPRADLQQNGIHITGYCQPAASVGGDYYDYFILPPDRLGVLIGDVTGHGFYSGLIMAMAKSCLITQRQIDPTVESVMKAVNRIVCLNSPEWLFMSFCYILVDRQSQTFTYANAGHNAPYHYHRQTKSWTLLKPTTHPLGIQLDAAYPVVQCAWSPGDTLILYSDGIVEAENAQGELFGEARLEQALTAASDQPPLVLKHMLLEHLNAFCQGVPQHDDVTFVVVRL